MSNTKQSATSITPPVSAAYGESVTASIPQPASDDGNIVRSIEGGILSDVSAESITGKNGSAYILLSLCKTYISKIDEQRKDFQNQINQQQTDYLAQIEKINSQTKSEIGERQKIIDAKSTDIINLSVENGFCKSLKAVNIIGAATTLIGTTIVGFVTPLGKWWLIVLGCA